MKKEMFMKKKHLQFLFQAFPNRLATNSATAVTRKFFSFPGKIYLFKCNNRNTRKRYDIVTTLMTSLIKTLMTSSGIFIVNFEHMSQLFLKFLLLNLNK